MRSMIKIVVGYPGHDGKAAELAAEGEEPWHAQQQENDEVHRREGYVEPDGFFEIAGVLIEFGAEPAYGYGREHAAKQQQGVHGDKGVALL